MKRDKIFYIASAFTAAGVTLAVGGSFYCFPLFIVAAVLRPLLSFFPGFKIQADERELGIQSQAGDLAFIALILTLTGVVIIRSLQGHRADELYMLIAVGVVIRQLIGLFLIGEYFRAAKVVLGAIGVFLGLFIILAAGLHTPALLGVAALLIFVGLAVLIKKHPLAVLVTVAVLLSLIFFGFKLYLFNKQTLNLWVFIASPLLFTLACLLLGYAEDRFSLVPRQPYTLIGLLTFLMITVLGYTYSVNTQPPIDVIFKDLPRETTITIQGYPLRGTVTYYQNGKVKSGTLDSLFTFGNTTLPRNSKVYFSENGTVDFAFLPNDYRINGYDCKGEGPENWQIRFYPDGRLKVFWPAKDVIIQGIPCRASDIWSDILSGESSVRLHPNGKLQHAKLADDITIEGKQFKKNMHIDLDSTGLILTKL